VKHTILAIALFMALSTVGGMAEAVVLPVGTTVIYPDATPNLNVDEASFLLTREDMEAATLALETVRIREEQIAKLTTSYNDLYHFTIVALPITAFLAVATTLLIEAIRTPVVTGKTVSITPVTVRW
jgi:hypothetical protein